jgi:hypothetical protein
MDGKVFWKDAWVLRGPCPCWPQRPGRVNWRVKKMCPVSRIRPGRPSPASRPARCPGRRAPVLGRPISANRFDTAPEESGIGIRMLGGKAWSHNR